MVIFVLKGEKWYDKLFNVKYLPLFHHFKAIYQFPKHIIFFVKIVANASLNEHIFGWTSGRVDNQGSLRRHVYYTIIIHSTRQHEF
jgi:hypothetical protein